MTVQERVEDSVRVTKEAWSEIKGWSLKERLQWLRQLDYMLMLNKDKILFTVASEKNESEHQVLLNEYMVVRSLCRYYYSNAKKILADENRSRLLSLNWGNKKVVVKKEPLGAVGVISPSNYPFSLPMSTIISALLAGNGVILKPAPECPETNLLIYSLVRRSLNPFGDNMSALELFDCLYDAPDSIAAGEALVRSPLIEKVHFTGSAKVGHRISEINAQVRSMPVTLELGGSNPAIVLEDADIKETARVIVWARFCGMSCNNIKRVFAVAPIYKALYEEVKSQVNQLLKYETGTIPKKEINNYRRFLEDYLDNNKEKPSNDRVDLQMHLRWNLFKPEVLPVENPTDDLLVLREETFVPLLPIVKVADESEAIKWANKTEFGLGASVFTKSKERFQAVAGKLECGGVFHNDAMTEFAQAQVPFGGWKKSGSGYSHGPEGLLDFVRLKTVISDRWPAPKFQLYPWTERKMNLLRRFSDLISRLS